MNKRTLKKFSLTITLFLTLSSTTYAHSGRTDANGGHRDNKNVSGLGYYHYHHGYGPHLHENGVCPYDSSSTTSVDNSAQIEAEKQEAYNTGYSKGYDDGYNNKANNPSGYSSSYSNNFSEGYSSGYALGAEKLQIEKDSIVESAKTTGYNDGYSGNSNNSSSYSGKFSEVYKKEYTSSYNEGLQKRNTEIDSAKKQGSSLGLEDGYNKNKRENFEYDAKYLDYFISSYTESYSIGEKNLNDDIVTHSKESYLLGLKGTTINNDKYSNKYIKDACLESNNEGLNVYNTYLKTAPKIGSSYDKYTEYAKKNDNIKLDSDTNCFISIKPSFFNISVKSIIINILEIKPEGYSINEATTLLESFLTTKVLDSYEIKSSYKREDDNSLYTISNYSLSSDSKKDLPNKFTVIFVSDNNTQLINQIFIYKKEPFSMKLISKID